VYERPQNKVPFPLAERALLSPQAWTLDEETDDFLNDLDWFDAFPDDGPSSLLAKRPPPC
jgi:hypothetical protein